ncbi:flagellar hook-associated protein FlgL [Legionella sp. CNM-4043-24]|uniref:flagellar hook-associated protein FlgL n=1 Tax=Legionella sp. CNM-4043-24 TaxID=3421646 RepID=UPI00403B28D5
MRLPTVNQFKTQIQSLSQQFDDVERLKRQGTTGKKIQRSSEDPMLAGKIRTLTNAMQTSKGYSLNNTLATSRVSLLNTTLDQSTDLIGKIKDLILAAQSDTLSNANRASIAEELKGYAETLLGFANTQDDNGEYIFSGMNVRVAPFIRDNSGYHYQGGAESIRIALDSNTSIPFNDSGYRVFGDIKTGNGYFTVSSDRTNNTGNGVASPINQINSLSMVKDDYTVTFVTNGSGQLAYQLTGATSGQVIPALPAVSPADAPAYVDGGNIIFNGMSFQITGQPNVGDTFYVEQSRSQNLFDTLDEVIKILSTPVNTDKDRADLHQVLGEQGTSFTQAFNHILQYFTEVGNRGKTIDDQKVMTENRIKDQEYMLDRLSNAPMEEVMPELVQKMTSLELTQQSYLKIQETLHRLYSTLQ